jgi:signal transduction histidine kinase
MTGIGGFLTRIEPLLWFIHGLTFFTLGVVLMFLAPRAARLEVARRLPLLAVFGFCEAVLAWDRAPIPGLEANQLVPPLVRMVLAGGAYVFLLAFGLLALRPTEHSPPARISFLAFVGSGWLLSMVVLLMTGLPATYVAPLGETLARCGFALPGGLLAAWGLRRQARRTMERRMLRRVKWPLRIAGGTLGLFALLACLQAMYSGPAFPILYTLCGTTLTVSIARALNAVQDEIERWIERAEQSQALIADRERISRELHDGTIQAIYAAGLMLEGVMQLMPNDPAAAQEQLSHVMRSLNQAIQDIRRYIFDLRGKMPEADLQTGLEQLLRDFRVNTLLETELTVHGDGARPLRGERRGHVFQIVREALSNTARHARARKVAVDLAFRPDSLQLRIADDGVGLDQNNVGTGQGLRNIRERVRLLEGQLDIDSAPGEGVTMTLTVPY